MPFGSTAEKTTSFGVRRRHIVMGVAAAGLAGTAHAAPDDLLGIPGPVTVGNTRYLLAASFNPSPGYYKHEYLPAGQTFERFTQMLLIEVLTASITTQAAANAQVSMLNQRKQTDPIVNYRLLRHPDNGELVLDFVMSNGTGDSFIVEWNAYRYARHGNGVMVFGLCRRAYGMQDTRTFLQTLRTTRETDIALLVRQTLPTPRIR